MQKLCCFPCSETPSMDVDVKCVSTCCGSGLSDSLNQENDTVENKTVEKVTTNLDDNCCNRNFAKTACCCCGISKEPSTNRKSQKKENNCQDE